MSSCQQEYFDTVNDGLQMGTAPSQDTCLGISLLDRDVEWPTSWCSAERGCEAIDAGSSSRLKGRSSALAFWLLGGGGGGGGLSAPQGAG